MLLENLQKRFFEEIKLRAYDDKYIDKIEEREIMQVAIHQGIATDAARAALEEVCRSQGYVLESNLVKLVRDRLQTAIGNAGTIDQAGFENIFREAKEIAAGVKNDRELKKLMVVVMEDHALNQVKSGWLKNWYSALKKDLGIS